MRAKVLALVLASLAVTYGLSPSARADDASAAQWIAQGERAASSGDWASAAKAFAQAMQSPTWKSRALYDLSVADYHMGYFPQALAAVKSAIQLNDRFVSAHIQLATILTRTGDYTGAESALKHAIQIDPQSTVARANLSQIRNYYLTVKPAQQPSKTSIAVAPGMVKPANQGQKTIPTAEAVKSTKPSEQILIAAEKVEKIEKVEKADKTDALTSASQSQVPQAPLIAAAAPQQKEPVLNDRASTQTKLAKSTKDLVLVAAGKFDLAPSVVVAPKPKSDLILAAAGKFELGHEPSAPTPEVKRLSDLVTASQSQDKPGLKHFVRLTTIISAVKPEVGLNKLSPSAKLKENALQLRQRAVAQFSAGDVDSAKYSLKRAINLDPRSSDARVNLGVVLGVQGDFSGDAEQQRAALELNPKNAAAHFNLGWALAQQNNWVESFKQYDIALKLNPRMSDAIGGKALALTKVGQIRDGVEMLIQAKRAYPTSAWPCVSLATVYMNEKRADEAKIELQDALAREPQSIEAHKQLAQFYLTLARDWKSAETEYLLALNMAPYDAEAYLGMASAQQCMKKDADAVKSLRIAVQIAPGSAVAHATLSNSLEKLGQRSEAEQEAKLALHINPKQELADSVLKRTIH